MTDFNTQSIVKSLHDRDGHVRYVFIANVVVAFCLFGLLIASLVLLIIEKPTSTAKAAVDFGLSVFFFIAVVLLVIGELLFDRKTRLIFNTI